MSGNTCVTLFFFLTFFASLVLWNKLATDKCGVPREVLTKQLGLSLVPDMSVYKAESQKLLHESFHLLRFALHSVRCKRSLGIGRSSFFLSPRPPVERHLLSALVQCHPPGWVDSKT